MKDIIPLDFSRCLGDVSGEYWGDADRICELRDYCKRYKQRQIDVKQERFVSTTGWACASEDKEMFLPVEKQEELF